MDSSGNFHADGNIFAYSATTSDRRLKDDIIEIESPLAKVDELTAYEFTYKKDGKRAAGVMAQDVEKVLPQAVGEDALLALKGDDTMYKYVDYDQLIGLLVGAVKELKAEVEELKAK